MKGHLPLLKANRSETPRISLHFSYSVGQQASGPRRTAEARFRARLGVSSPSCGGSTEVGNEETQFHEKGKEHKFYEGLCLKATKANGIYYP